MIPTYGRVLSAIEKALQELVEEYRRVRKSLGLGRGLGEGYSPIGEDWDHDGAEMGLGRREQEGGEQR